MLSVWVGTVLALVLSVATLTPSLFGQTIVTVLSHLPAESSEHKGCWKASTGPLGNLVPGSGASIHGGAVPSTPLSTSLTPHVQ